MISWKRFVQWLGIVRVTNAWWRLVPKFIRMGIQMWRNPIGKKEWRRRMRVCGVCGIYDPERKVCMGCGCYTPYSNQVKDECWGASQGYGWTAGGE